MYFSLPFLVSFDLHNVVIYLVLLLPRFRHDIVICVGCEKYNTACFMMAVLAICVTTPVSGLYDETLNSHPLYCFVYGGIGINTLLLSLRLAPSSCHLD